MDVQYLDLTERIIQVFHDVYDEFGYGFSANVYLNSLVVELKARGLNVETQQKITVFYKGVVVGYYTPDLLVNGLVLVEVKATESISSEFEHQLINCLRATDIEIGLLLNFGKKPQIRRKTFLNAQKMR